LNQFQGFFFTTKMVFLCIKMRQDLIVMKLESYLKNIYINDLDYMCF